jgi:hypothetical protein
LRRDSYCFLPALWADWLPRRVTVDRYGDPSFPDAFAATAKVELKDYAPLKDGSMALGLSKLGLSKLGLSKLGLSKNGCDDKHPATASIPLEWIGSGNVG